MNRQYTQREGVMARQLEPAINAIYGTLTMNDPTRGPEEVAECTDLANRLIGFLVDLADIVTGDAIQNATVANMVNGVADLDMDIVGAPDVRPKLMALVTAARNQLDALARSIQT